MYKLEDVIQNKYFSDIQFSDERERQVFLSYMRGFSLLILDPCIHRVLEIGGGQSTALLATLGARLGWEIVTVDMNPEAVRLKLRGQRVSETTMQSIRFYEGVSLSKALIRSYYERDIVAVGAVPFLKALQASKDFVDITMDGRKAPRVAEALGLSAFSSELVLDAIAASGGFSPELLSAFRTPGDEFEFDMGTNRPSAGVLEEIMGNEIVDAVFLDSGEFSSLPEWTVVNCKLREGGYVILHDILFPKSFKNWLVCGSIVADPAYEVLYVDCATPQGLMVARKKN